MKRGINTLILVIMMLVTMTSANAVSYGTISIAGIALTETAIVIVSLFDIQTQLSS